MDFLYSFGKLQQFFPSKMRIQCILSFYNIIVTLEQKKVNTENQQFEPFS